MNPRFLPQLLLALTLVLAADTSAQRHRAVRSAGPQCAFSLNPTFGTTVSSAGFDNGTIQVIGTPATCTSWNAYSLTDWVTVERVNDTVLVDVAPNPTNLPRTAVLLIAGIRQELIQENAPAVTPPVDAGNLLKNPGFDTGLLPWGWQDRFPNGTGNAAWAPLDAANNPNSGSIRLRNTRPPDGTPAYQQLQCANVESGTIYEYGGKFFASSATAGGAIFAIVEYADEDCNVSILTKQVKSEASDTPGSWQSVQYAQRLGPTTKSVFIVIASSAKSPGTFDVHFDDVFLRKR